VEIITGGGVATRNDLAILAQAGVDAALVASALHDGRIGRSDIEVVEAS
jgi:phosphoribosylformimino-5-aminoimidazole carboxamide ribotide isomerase